MLDAPKEVLGALNISVVGGKPDQLEDLIIPIKKGDEVQAVVAAIPFLRDIDLRKSVVGEAYEDTQEAIRASICQIFEELGKLCKAKYGQLPAIAMGHLFAHGAKTSDSEREIQIGNLAGFKGDEFSNDFDYYALGHIHKPQKVNAEGKNIYYSGSPIALSFSEKKDEKRVLVYDTSQKEVKSVEAPKFRTLSRITGSMVEIKAKTQELATHEHPLENLLEIHLQELDYSAVLMREFDVFVSEFEKEGYRLVHRTVSFERSRKQDILLMEKGTNIEELKPLDVFEKRLEGQQLSAGQAKGVKEAFLEILQELQQGL
jgi:exonuclease SbcD